MSAPVSPVSRAFAAIAAAGLFLTSGPVTAADFYWDVDGDASGNNVEGTGLGGVGLWDLASSRWWDGTALGTWSNALTDNAIFSYPFPSSPYAIPVTQAVTVDAGGVSANRITFQRSGYALSGGAITLGGTGAGVYVNLGESATISSQISGSNGLTKTGGGSVRLENASNNYTGTTTIANGTLIINSAAALGGTGTVSILTNNNTPLNTGLIGFGGGSLVLDGTAGGFTFSRDVDFEGRGPIGDRGAAIQSLGNNTLSGTLRSAISPLPLAPTATIRNSRINSVNGTLNLTGVVNTGGTAATTFLAFGGVNSAGTGNYSFANTGSLTGTGSIEKSGGGTLFLNSLASNAGFTGTVRVTGSATGQQSSVRVTDLLLGGNNVFGGNAGTNASATIDMNGGVLEIRNDNSLNVAKNVYWRASSTYYTGPAPGGSAINGTTTFGALRVASNTTGTFNSRNGFGMTFGTWTQENSNANLTVTNNMAGTLTFTGNVWNNSDPSNRVLAIGGNGNTTINGFINATVSAHTLTKSGSGVLTIRGQGTSTLAAVSVQGSLAITDFRSINNNSSSITLGNATTTAGNLIIGTDLTPTEAGLTTSRPIILSTTTVSPSIYANQPGTNPVVLNGAITRTTQTTGGLILGGTNTADNVVNVGIPNAGTGGVTKTGAGTWVLAGVNTYSGPTTIVNGTLKIKANAASSTVFAATHDITFGNSNVFAGGTLEFVGQDGVNNVQALDVLTTTSGAGTIRLTPGAGGTASLTFASQASAGTGTVNFVGADFVNNKITITGGNGLVSRTNYWEGADFAYRESNVLRAPVYNSDSGFVSSASALTGSANMEITGSFATNTLSISTLKIVGDRTLTLNAAQTLTLSNGGVLVTSGDATITGGTALALGSQTLVVRTNLEGDSLNIQSVITGSGGLTKGGEGTLILSGVNAQTGTVTINEGTVRLSGTGTLGAAAALTMRQGTVLDLNGVTPSTNTNAFNNNGSVTSASPATFTVGGSNGTGTSFGTVNGAISLTKIGTGGQSWLGASSYTGVTTIGSTGLVTVDLLADIGEDSGIGRGDSTSDATNAASLVFNGSTGGLGYVGSIRNGELVLGSRSASTNRLFTLAPTSTGATLSSTASNNNAIVWRNTGAIVNNTTANATLIFTGSGTGLGLGDNTFNPRLMDSSVGGGVTLGVSKTGTGQWNLGNPNNSYTGLTTVANGVLALNDNGALPANSPVALGTTTTSGVLQMSGTFARNLSAAPAAGTGTVSWIGTTGGGGFAAHTTPLTVTLNLGAGLTWGSGGFVPSGAPLVFGSASALSDVTFTNAIDLGAAIRTITVNENSNTGADFVTFSGVLSGTGAGLLKSGSGVLRVGNANTYTGLTQVQGGTLVVTSLGSSTGGASSSVGAGGVGMGNTNAIELGAGGNNSGILQYVGPGETSDRKIRFNSTTGTSSTNQIHADGSGPLILTNVANDMTAGAKTVVLRGSNVDGNMITSVLGDNGGALSVTVDGGATWILTGANTFTGSLTSSAGALGIGNAAAVGAGTLINSNGNIFAYGADRTITNALQLNSGASHGFIGEYSLTFSSAVALAASTSSNNFTNNSIIEGKALVFAGGVAANSLTATRNWQLDGSGETIITGNFTTSTTFGVNLIKTGDGILTLGTNGATSNWNQAGNNVDVDRGTLKFTANNAIPSASSANGGLALTPEVATFDAATVDLNGTTQTVNTLTANSNGTLKLDNSSSSAATFRFGANNSDINFGGTSLGTVAGIGSYTITDSGTGALSIVKLGSTATTFGSHVVLTHQGTTATEGGTLTINANLAGSTGLSASGGSILQLNGAWTTASGALSLSASGGSTLGLTGGITSPNLVTSIEVGRGSVLSLLDGAGSQFANLTTLNLGNTGSGTVTLNLNVGDLTTAGDGLQTDTLTLLTGGTLNLGGTITFNLTDAGLNPGETYTLLNLTDGGITAFGIGNMIQGATPGGFDSMTWFVDNNLVQLTTGNLLLNNLYWRGSTNNTWNANVNNWSLNKDGTGVPSSIPGQGNTVIFAYDGVGAGALTTTLEQNFKVNALVFESGTTTPASVAINPGALATARLEIAPQDDADGITISAGGPAAVSISANLRLGADQTWNVVDAGTTLTLGGTIFGEANVTKDGPGSVILGGAADPTFNAGQTATFTIEDGNVEFTNVAAFGTLANSNLVDITLNGGGLYFNNATSGTIANDLILNGGTLSAGRAAGTAAVTSTYSGAVNISGASFVNLRDRNTTAVTTVANNITLSGLVGGTGSLTVESDEIVSTLVGGNAELGTLLISNAGSSWTGDLIIKSGTVDIAAAASATVLPGDITFDGFGRLIVRGVNGQSITRSTDTLTFTAGTIGEYLVDNTSAVLAADFVVNQNGQVNIGSGGTGASARFTVNDAATSLNIGGSVILGGNSSISVDGGDADSFVTISSVISDGGSGYSLAVNDDAGGWAVTNDILRLTGANTFSGNVSISDGALEFTTVTNAGGAASALGQGTAISMAGGILRFVGTTAQSTDRPITTTNSATLSANGDEAADTITYTGAINQATNNSLTLSGAASREGILTGGITQAGETADLTVNGGTWTLSGTISNIADDVTVTGIGTILNLSSAGILNFGASTGNLLLITNGGTVNLGASGTMTGMADTGIYIAQSAGGAEAVLNMNAFNQTTLRLILGERLADRSGRIDGTGTLTVDGTTGIELYRGTINANLASTAATPFNKYGPGIVTLKGDNSGIQTTTAAIINEGTLVLDYTASNTTKLRALSALDMRGGNLVLTGNNSAASAQTVASFTLGSGGNNTITLTPGMSQSLVLNLNAITRANSASDGTIRFNLPSGTQSATNGITTDMLNTVGTGANAILGGWATVNDGTGVFFARNVPNTADGNIGAAVTTSTDAIASWLTGENISDSTGFTGTLTNAYINSLRFNAASAAAVTMTSTGVFGIASGGILVTDSAGGTPGILNGTIFSGAQASNVPELIITSDSAAVFELSADLRTNSAFTKSGSGTVVLSGNNSYTGPTDVQNGVLRISGGNAIGDTSSVNISNSRNTTLELLDDETIGRLTGGRRNDNSDYGTVAIGGHTLSLNVAGDVNYDGFLTGSGTLVKAGASFQGFRNISSGFTGEIVINQGGIQLSGVGAINASSFTINKSGAMDIANTGTTSSTTRILNTTPIVLNSADGAMTGTGGAPRLGLTVRNDNNSDRTEAIGNLVFNSGASYLSGDANVSTGNARAGIAANNFIRSNSATVAVRGRNLGTTTAHNIQFRISEATNQTAFINAMVGGGGAAGSKTISIVPWALGETHNNTALAITNMGNSLVTYVSGTGFRPLDLTNEYHPFSVAGATNNTRESLGADLTGLAGRTLNSLVIDNTAVTGLDFMGNGAGESLVNTSGAFLFTVTGGADSTAYDTTLGGFDSGIAVGSTNEYVFFVVNPSSAATTPTLTASILSPLTSSADITKSGRGTLILSGTNTAGGGTNKTTINEGTLQISDLDNIGGNSGSLVFAGGTLRLGVGFADDLSSRTISYLAGGGTLDTNGIDLALAGSLGSGSGGFTKAGAGNLTLNASATYTGNSVLSLGTVTIGASNALGIGGNLTLNAGTTLALGTNSLAHGLVSTAGASPLITGNGTISASTGFFLNHTGDTSIDAVLAGPGGLRKAQTNVVTLSGASTYTGTTEILAGTLTINSIANVGGGASALGAPTTAENGIIRMGLTTAATILQYTGTGHSSNRLIGMQGTTGGVTLDADGTGAFGVGGVRMENAGAKTLTLRGSSDAALVNTIGSIQETGGVLTLNKTDANTWQIEGVSTFTGVTQIDDGTLRLGLDDALPLGTTVRLGTGAAAGSLDLNGFSQTVASLLVQTNSASVSNTLVIDTGETFTVTGAVTIGANVAASTTLFSATGGGTFVNNNSGGTFQIGGATGGTNSNTVTADFSGLSAMTIDLGATGTFRVGDASSATVLNPSTLKLASDTTITAGTVRVGDGSGPGAVHTLVLGDGTNLINANTINIGSAGTSIRSSGQMNFDVADTTGTLTLRAADGTGRAVMNMINTTGSTATDMSSTVDLTGHTSDLLVSTLTMASRTQGANAATSTFSFDQGTLDITTLNMASRTTASSSGNATATVNLGDSAAVGSPTTTIGTLNMAVNTSAGGTVVADLNVTGGNVTIGTGSGTAINMANAGTGRTVTSTIDLTGGTVNVTGNIVRTGGAGTENATITLDGAILDLNDNNIGSSTAVVNLVAQSGTLRNLNELNGGGNLTKTGAGALVLEGDNDYTGRTVITAGTVSISSEDNLGNAPVSFTAAQLEINGGTLLTTATMSIDDTNRGITIGSSGGTIETAAATNLTIAATNPLVLDGTLTKSGDGALYIDSTTSGTGLVQVNDGTFGGTGTISGNTTIGADGTLTAATTGTTGTLTFSGDLTLVSGSTWLIDLVQDNPLGVDRINVIGNLNLGGATLDFKPTNAFSGHNYVIATFGNGPILGSTFAGLNEGDTIGNYTISYGAVTAGAITLTAVPEPGTLGLLGVALGGFFFRRLRRRRTVASLSEEGGE